MSDKPCPFCSLESDRIISESDYTVTIRDGFPVSEGHTLIIPKRHTTDFFSMTEAERNDAQALLRILKKRLASGDESIEGFNVGMNCGEVAGQTIPHAHVHLIPRRKGDTPNPRGGVRGVIPGKMGY